MSTAIICQIEAIERLLLTSSPTETELRLVLGALRNAGYRLEDELARREHRDATLRRLWSPEPRQRLQEAERAAFYQEEDFPDAS